MTTTPDNQGDEEKDLTPEERLQWLKDRGVVVETPEDRKKEADAAKSNASAVSSSSTEDAITYVYIPANAAKPLEELKFVPPSNSKPTQFTDPLADSLKPAFASKADQVDLNLFRKQQSDNPIHQLASGGSRSDDASASPPSVSDDTLRQVAQQGGHVEAFSLVHATSSNQYTAVNFYLDEIGQLKRLPLNGRATDLAKAAGYTPPPIFYGDVFVAKKQRQHYLNMTINDCHVQAPWLRQAAVDNLEYQIQMNQLTGRRNDVTQAAVAGSDGVAKNEEGYSWTQSEEEVEIVVALPDDSASSKKDISVSFKPQMVVIKIQNHDDASISISLFERVDVDGCTWTMGKDDARNTLVVTLEKADEALWPRLEN